MKQGSLSQQFLNATLWNTILFPARLLVGLLASVIYYQRLSLDQVGVLFLLTSLSTTIGLYADLGIERTLPRFLPEVERRSGRAGVERLMTQVIRLKLIVLLFLVICLAAFSAPLVRALATDQKKEVAGLESRERASLSRAEARDLDKQLSAKRTVVAEIEDKGRLFVAAVALLLLLGALFDVYMQFLTAYLKQRSWNLITLVSTLLQPVLVTAFILLGWRIGGVLLGLVIAPLVCVLLARWQVARASRELGSPGPTDAVEDASLRGRFVRFAAVNYLMQVTTWMYDLQFVVFLSAATLSLADVALLGFAYKFAKDFLGYVWTPLTGVMTPVLARIHVRGEPKALVEAHATLTRVIWLLVLPAGVGLALLTPRLVATLYPKYTMATTLIVIFTASTFGESLLSVPHNVLMVVEQYRVVVVSRLLALASIPLVYLLLPRYGLVGVAVGVGAARILARLVTVVYGMKGLGLNLPLPFLGRVVLASAGMAMALLATSHAYLPRTAYASTWSRAIDLLPAVALAVLGGLVYALLLRLLGGLDEAERRRLLEARLPFRSLLARILGRWGR